MRSSFLILPFTNLCSRGALCYRMKQGARREKVKSRWKLTALAPPLRDSWWKLTYQNLWGDLQCGHPVNLFSLVLPSLISALFLLQNGSSCGSKATFSQVSLDSRIMKMKRTALRQRPAELGNCKEFHWLHGTPPPSWESQNILTQKGFQWSRMKTNAHSLL